MTYPIQFVSLGPGDPKLLTIQSAEALQKADLIIVPSISTPSGKESSRAYNLIREANITTPITQVLLPMSQQREGAMQSYEEMFQLAKKAYFNNKKVAVAVEGDAGIYASTHYVLDRLQKENIPTEQLAGIPSFIEAASLAQLHLVSQYDRLLIIPGNISLEEIEKFIANNYTLVIMKLSRFNEKLKNCITIHPEYEYHYFENICSEKFVHIMEPELIIQRPLPYFSLIVIRKKQ